MGIHEKAVKYFVVNVKNIRYNNTITRNGKEWHVMGVYLNSETAYTLFKREAAKPYFVDKSKMLTDLFAPVGEGSNYVCITRPRRFGKTVMANMITSFFSKAVDAGEIFQNLRVARHEEYKNYLNRYPVIHISFSDTEEQCSSYSQYISWILKNLINDIKEEYPVIEQEDSESAIGILTNLFAKDSTAEFIFILDEWDFIFHQSYVSEEDKQSYLTFLRSLLKDRPYVRFAYMTGILPIAKYSSGSELNMFEEYTMVTEEMYSDYFGFTESEVDELFERYQNRKTGHQKITREGLKYWYNGYHTSSGERLYNPRSVVLSLKNNNFGNYWTSSGPYDEIFYYIEKNVAAVRDDLALMISGIEVPMEIWEYAATSMNLETKEEIFSAMVVYGFLSYENGNVYIPNKELMNKFSQLLQKEPSFDYVYRLANESKRMLQATLHGDTDTMAEILEWAHNTEVPLLSYNHETELTAIVNLVYLAARSTYRVEREDKGGIGYVDVIFYPETNPAADCIILELKVDATPEAAIKQIKEKKYALRFQGKLGEKSRYTGRILAVGISYDKTKKTHRCVIEVLGRF